MGTTLTVPLVPLSTGFGSFPMPRSMILVPRKLTDEELAEEQAEDMDEDESGPVMGM